MANLNIVLICKKRHLATTGCLQVCGGRGLMVSQSVCQLSRSLDNLAIWKLFAELWSSRSVVVTEKHDMFCCKIWVGSLRYKKGWHLADKSKRWCSLLRATITTVTVTTFPSSRYSFFVLLKSQTALIENSRVTHMSMMLVGNYKTLWLK